MEFLILVISILGAVVQIALRKRATIVTIMRAGSLCRTCVNSQVVRGFRGKELISCTFGGTLRAIKFEVSECTGFSNRLVTITPVRVVGFVKREDEVYAEVRI
jgi:hypothetical protein